MKAVQIYPAHAGGWIYEVWFHSRPVLVGWCATRQAAEHEADMA